MNELAWLELIAAVTIPVSVIAIIVQRIWLKQGIGVRAIQFLTVSMVLPLILRG